MHPVLHDQLAAHSHEELFVEVCPVPMEPFRPILETRKELCSRFGLEVFTLFFYSFFQILFRKLLSLAGWTKGHANAVVLQFLGFFTVFRMVFTRLSAIFVKSH